MTLDVADHFAVPGSWAFTAQVADAFDDHVEASVPHYGVVQALVAEAADWLAPAGAVIADLGCATGTTAAAIAARHPDRGYTFELYDASADMLDQAAVKLAEQPGVAVHLHRGRLEAGLHHGHASLTVCLFTLQFLDPLDRASLLTRARGASRDEGAILVAEKLRLPDSRWHEIAGAVSHDYKHARGVADQAIRAKERALRGVLNPLTDHANRRLLDGAGWRSVEVLFRWHSWALYGALAS